MGKETRNGRACEPGASGEVPAAPLTDLGGADASQLLALLRAGPVAVLTGAGLSTASGIPAYRDRHGQWQHPQPVQHQDFMASEAVRRRYWARSCIGWPRIAASRPNAGHAALAELERCGRVRALITQNVDGLHREAGSRALIELHGSLSSVVCMACGAIHERHEVQGWLEALNAALPLDSMNTAACHAPDGDMHLHDGWYAHFQVPPCPRCGGVLKPDVVFFGDNVPRERVAQAFDAVEESHALLVIGSSLMVYSGYRFADKAHREGKTVAAINDGVTRADDVLHLKVQADCVAVLQWLVQNL